MFDDIVQEICKGHQPLPVVDTEAERRSKEVDAVADRKWFLRHPRATYRDRPPSALETAARALPPGSTVRAARLPDGTQFRVYCVPESSSQSSKAV